MALIDDEGNLFGVVNVIDALAVLLVLAVAVAGIAVVGLLGGGGEDDVRYATVDLGSQPDYVVDRIDAGDEMIVDGHDQNVTVTDAYVTPGGSDANNESTSVTVRVEIEGTLVDHETRDRRVFEHAGERLRVGQEFALETENYAASGQFTAIDQTESELSLNETQVLLETELPTVTADEIRAGDEYRVAGRTIGTVETVQTYPIGGDRHRALVGLELATLERGGTPTFGGSQLGIGSTIEFRTGAYDLTGEVVRRGAVEEAGEATTTEATLRLENVEPERAERLEAGMTETVRGETQATVTDVETAPAEVVLESEDGDIHLREHPRNKDVELTVELRTRETPSTLRFHGDTLREGESLTLDFRSTIVSGEIVRLE